MIPQWNIYKNTKQRKPYPWIVRAFLKSFTLTKQDALQGFVLQEGDTWTLRYDDFETVAALQEAEEIQVIGSFQQFHDGTYWAVIRKDTKSC